MEQEGDYKLLATSLYNHYQIAQSNLKREHCSFHEFEDKEIWYEMAKTIMKEKQIIIIYTAPL